MSTAFPSSSSTLHSRPFADVAALLRDAASASEQALHERFAKLSEAERADIDAQVRNTPASAFYKSQAKDLFLSVSPDTAHLLYMLARTSGARSVVEFGTSFGVSTLHLAAALRDNGGGRIVTCEFEPSKVVAARKTFDEAGVADLIEVREGDALQTLARDLPEQIDLVLLDGAKALYLPVLHLLAPRLKQGAAIVADNADWSAEYLAHVRGGGAYLSVPFGPDVELSVKL